MKSFVIVAVFLATLALASADIWSNCGTSADHFKISTVTITPDPPVIGQNLTVTASGTLDETVTAGEISIKIKYGFITVVNQQESLCNVAEGVCPLKAGPYSKSITVEVPTKVPAGHYTGKVQVEDQNNQEVACISVDMQLK